MCDCISSERESDGITIQTTGHSFGWVFFKCSAITFNGKCVLNERKKSFIQRNCQQVILLEFFWLKWFCKRTIADMAYIVSWKIIKPFERAFVKCAGVFKNYQQNWIFHVECFVTVVVVSLSSIAMTFNSMGIVLLMLEDAIFFSWPE